MTVYGIEIADSIEIFWKRYTGSLAPYILLKWIRIRQNDPDPTGSESATLLQTSCIADPVHSLCRHETFLPAPAETEKAANEKAKKDGEKPKDKVRTAKKIQKDMEKWAKMLNQKKESQKVAVAPPAVLPAPATPHTQKGGHIVQWSYWDTCRLSPMNLICCVDI